MTVLPRLFHLQRDHDVTGVSGTGRVADGVLWPDGTVSIRWTGPMPSTVFWHSLANALHVHGHGGATRIVWADEQPPADRAAVLREWIGPQGAEDRASARKDAPHVRNAKRSGVVLQRPVPAVAIADELVPAAFDAFADDGPDHRIQAGAVAPAGEHADAHSPSLEAALARLAR